MEPWQDSAALHASQIWFSVHGLVHPEFIDKHDETNHDVPFGLGA